MINFGKSQPAPSCLESEKEKDGDYKCGDVLERLKSDFRNKCYICESKAPATINVEHFVAHRNDKELKFDWDNLFWSCGHCNNTKLAKYDNLLDCTDSSTEVDKRLIIRLNPWPKELVVIVATDDDAKTRETQQLLHEVYNGTTSLKCIESANLRDEMLKEIRKFQTLVLQWFDIEPHHDKGEVLASIRGHLSNSSAFTAVKRWIIRDHEKLFEVFGQYI
ncbi:MAG: hypothetical protein AAFX06_34045 [Planctomycetota bacterium]